MDHVPVISRCAYIRALRLWNVHQRCFTPLFLRTRIPVGIRWHKCNRKWEVQIKYRGKKLSLGYFDDELVAAQCYDRRAKELYETPLLNFLPGGKLNPERKRRVDPRSLR